MLKSLLCTIIVCALATSCQSASSKKTVLQELRLNIHSEPPSLDPRKPADTTSINVIRMCFDGLIRYNEKGEQSLALAEKIDRSEDGRIYTFTLKGAKWSDGKAVTSDDFVEAWRDVLDPGFPSEYASELYVIKNGRAVKEGSLPMSALGLKVIDERTFSVELEHPFPYFLDLLLTHSFYPAPSHVTRKRENWAYEGGPSYVCNGPFQLAEWKHQNRIVLIKNPSYWDAENVKLDRLSLYMVEDETTELSMYENDELDWIGSPLSSIPTDALATLGSHKEFRLYPMAGTYYYIFNTKRPPFHNANIRKAFAIAIHRKEIIDNITQSKQAVATSLVPKSMWSEGKSYFKDADMEEARRYFALGLEELKMQVKDFPPIKLSYNTASTHHKIAQAIKEQWSNAFNVRVHLENMEWKVFLDEVGHGKFQIARMGGVANYNDPISFLEVYKYSSSRMNPSQWSSPAYAAMLDKADTIKDRDERLKVLAQAESILMEEMPIAPIYFYTGAYLKKPYVKQVHLSHLSDIDFKYAYREVQ